jgi:four helix bundle protein
MGGRKGMTVRNRKHSTFNIQRSTDIGSLGESWRVGEGQNRKFDLEDRLLEFASAVIDLSEKMPNTRAGNHVAGQMLRSGTAPYPNHGEAEAAESRDDFIHKLKICLKELRETRRWARLIQQKGWARESSILLFLLSESDELIRIFHASIHTAQRNALTEQRKRGSGLYPSRGAG